MPAEELVTVPAPVPALVTVKPSCLTVKLALTVCAWLRVTVQVEVDPVQAPAQPPKVESAAGTAVKVTVVFWL